MPQEAELKPRVFIFSEGREGSTFRMLGKRAITQEWKRDILDGLTALLADNPGIVDVGVTFADGTNVIARLATEQSEV